MSAPTPFTWCLNLLDSHQDFGTDPDVFQMQAMQIFND
jgi:hypothetical protein